MCNLFSVFLLLSTDHRHQKRGFAFRSTEFLKRNLYPTGLEYGRRRRVAGCRRKLFCISLVGLAGLFDGFVVQDEPSSCPGADGSAHCSSSDRARRQIWTKKNFFFFFSYAEWKTLQLVSLPPFQFALISWMKRPVFDVFDCSFVPDCFLLQFSLFLCCSIRRSPADFLERPAKRSGCTVTNSRATQSSRAGCPRRKTPTPFGNRPRLPQEKQDLSLSLSRLNRSCFPLVAMLQNRLVTRTKTSQIKQEIFVLSHSIYHGTRLQL